jgi:hypothetical protein
MKNVVKLAPPIKPCILLGVIYFWFMIGKSSRVPLVLRVYPTMLQVQFLAY